MLKNGVFPEIGVKKAYVIGDIYRSDLINEMNDDIDDDFDHNDFNLIPKVGVDTHLQRLIDLWGWLDTYYLINIEEEKKLPREFKKWSGRWNVEKSNLVSRIFSNHQSLIPSVNCAIVDVCQLFQSKNGGKFLGIGFLEILSILKNGIYADYIEKWYWKEFHFSTKNLKKKKMTDEEFQKEVEIRIAKARKEFYDKFFGKVSLKEYFIKPPKKKTKKTKDNGVKNLEGCTKHIIERLAIHFGVMGLLRLKWKCTDWDKLITGEKSDSEMIIGEDE